MQRLSSKNDSTALIHAAKGGHVSVAALLLDSGAEINARDDVSQSLIVTHTTYKPYTKWTAGRMYYSDNSLESSWQREMYCMPYHS